MKHASEVYAVLLILSVVLGSLTNFLVTVVMIIILFASVPFTVDL